MDGKKILGILLLVGGLAALFYGHLSYTRETRGAELGNASFSVAQKKDFAVPTWARIGALAGPALPAAGRR